MGKSLRKQEEIEHKRRQIMFAAARVFAREGYAGASMSALAAEAGYAAPTLYSYFKGKQDIFQALLEEIMSEIGANFELWVPEGIGLRQQLEMLLRHLMTWFDAHRDVLSLLISVTMLNQNLGVDKMQELPMNHVMLLEQWLKNTGSDLSELGPRTPRQMAWLIWGILHASLHETLHNGQEGSMVERVPEILDLIYYGLPGPSAAVGAKAG